MVHDNFAAHSGKKLIYIERVPLNESIRRDACPGAGGRWRGQKAAGPGFHPVLEFKYGFIQALQCHDLSPSRYHPDLSHARSWRTPAAPLNTGDMGVPCIQISGF